MGPGRGSWEKSPSCGVMLKRGSFSETAHLMGEQRVHRPLGSFLSECTLLAGARVLGCLICIRRASRCSQTWSYRGEEVLPGYQAV